MKYIGHCHCGKVQHEVEIDFDSAKVITCNCSHCHQKGLVLTFITPDKFKMISGEGDLTTSNLIPSTSTTCFVNTVACSRLAAAKTTRARK